MQETYKTWEIILGIILIFTFFPTLWYIRYYLRNSSMRKLALAYGLSFQSRLRPLFPMFMKADANKDIILDELGGKVGNHDVVIQDVVNYSLLHSTTVRGQRRTRMIVDGQPFVGKIQNLTLGSNTVFASILEIKKYLEDLRSN